MNSEWYSYQSAGAGYLPTDKLISVLRNQIFSMLDSLRDPVRVLVAGRTDSGKTAFLNLLMIALHNLVTFPLPWATGVHGTVRIRRLGVHAFLQIIDVIGADYETDAERELLRKIAFGVSDCSRAPRTAYFADEPSSEQLVRMVTDSLAVQPDFAVDEIIWLVNPCGVEPELGLPAKLLSRGPPRGEDLATVRQSVVFTHGDDCGVPAHELWAAGRVCWPCVGNRIYVASSYNQTAHDAPVPRSMERDLRALEFLAALLVRAQPSLARFLRQKPADE